MRRSVKESLVRESIIPEVDIEETVKQIIKYPYLGGKKGILKLIHDEKALIGMTNYKEIKKLLNLLVETERVNRKEQSELEKNKYKRLVFQLESYTKIVPESKHEIWSIDFTEIELYGMKFKVCVVYEIYSQSYLSLVAGDAATDELAKLAVRLACDYSGSKPKFYLLSDNAKQFISYSFKEFLNTLSMLGWQIPKAQPWDNGELESGNRDLKIATYTILLQVASKNPAITRIGVRREKVLLHLQDCLSESQKVINEEIVRPKFGTTPLMVLNDNVAKDKARQNLYVQKKLTERKQRMIKLKKQGGSKRRRIEDKVTYVWKKIASTMSNNEIYAFSQLINQDYRVVKV